MCGRGHPGHSGCQRRWLDSGSMNVVSSNVFGTFSAPAQVPPEYRVLWLPTPFPSVCSMTTTFLPCVCATTAAMSNGRFAFRLLSYHQTLERLCLRFRDDKVFVFHDCSEDFQKQMQLTGCKMLEMTVITDECSQSFDCGKIT